MLGVVWNRHLSLSDTLGGSRSNNKAAVSIVKFQAKRINAEIEKFLEIFTGILTNHFQLFSDFHLFRAFNPADISGSGILLAMALCIFSAITEVSVVFDKVRAFDLNTDRVWNL